MNYYQSCGTKNSRLKNCLGRNLGRKKSLLRQSSASKKTGFKQQDPLLILTYFVLLGVLLSSFTSFGL